MVPHAIGLFTRLLLTAGANTPILITPSDPTVCANGAESRLAQSSSTLRFLTAFNPTVYDFNFSTNALGDAWNTQPSFDFTMEQCLRTRLCTGNTAWLGNSWSFDNPFLPGDPAAGIPAGGETITGMAAPAGWTSDYQATVGAATARWIPTSLLPFFGGTPSFAYWPAFVGPPPPSPGEPFTSLGTTSTLATDGSDGPKSAFDAN